MYKNFIIIIDLILITVFLINIIHLYFLIKNQINNYIFISISLIILKFFLTRIYSKYYHNFISLN